MNGKQLADALLVELGKRKRGLLHRSFDEDSFADLIRSALDPQPEQPNYIPLAALPVNPPEFPKLKVKYDGKTGAALEWIVVQNGNDENPYRTWYTEPMTKIEFLQATNVPERPAEDWQRRKQLAEKGRQ